MHKHLLWFTLFKCAQHYVLCAVHNREEELVMDACDSCHVSHLTHTVIMLEAQHCYHAGSGSRCAHFDLYSCFQ